MTSEQVVWVRLKAVNEYKDMVEEARDRFSKQDELISTSDYRRPSCYSEKLRSLFVCASDCVVKYSVKDSAGARLEKDMVYKSEGEISCIELLESGSVFVG